MLLSAARSTLCRKAWQHKTHYVLSSLLDSLRLTSVPCMPLALCACLELAHLTGIGMQLKPHAHASCLTQWPLPSTMEAWLKQVVCTFVPWCTRQGTHRYTHTHKTYLISEFF